MKNTGQGLFSNNFSRATGAVITLLFLTLISTPVKAAIIPNPVSSDSVKNEVFAEAKILLVRMDEINAMDKTTFSPAEKKQLRKEVRVIKGHLKELDKGMYLPIGTLVILLFVPWIIFNFVQ